jgi:cytochrome c553
MRGPLILAMLLTAALPAVAEEAVAPAAMPTIAAQCLSCHGANGRPELADVPIIAGQQQAYLVNALMAYRSGNRAFGQALVMGEITRDLSDADIAALAQWFGDQQ